MNIAELSIRKSVITWVMTLLMIAVGIVSFKSLSRLEDPEFTIKEAVVYTPYPGASAAEVEKEVTNVIEKACQELGQLDYVESRSSRGLSIVKAVMKRKYDKYALPQVWDELRRKVNARPVPVRPLSMTISVTCTACMSPSREKGIPTKKFTNMPNFFKGNCFKLKMSNGSSFTVISRKPSTWKCDVKKWPSSVFLPRTSIMPWLLKTCRPLRAI
jgi:hypothetical protein